jgi:hypothetical protein
MLDRRQSLALLSACLWIGAFAWLVTGIHPRNPALTEFLGKLGEPLNAILLLVAPAVIGILLVGRWMRLQNWKQWAFLSAIVLFQGFLCVALLNESGRHVAETFAQFMNDRRHPPGLSHSDIELFGWASIINIGLGGLLITLLSPPGIRQRARSLLSTSERKQLVTALVVAIWVSGIVLSYHCPWYDAGFGCEQSELPRILGLVVPALLFGGIFFWWFGRGEKGSKSDLR